MDLVPKRRWSRDYPPDLSEIRSKLDELIVSLTKAFDDNELRIREILEDFKKVAAQVKQVQESKCKYRSFGLVGGVALGVGLLALPFTGRLRFAVAGASTAAVALGTVFCTNAVKMIEERRHVNTVEELGNKVNGIIEPIKKDLEEMRTSCQRLDKFVGIYFQAEKTLTDVEKFHRTLDRVSKLGRRVLDALMVAVQLIGVVGVPLVFTMSMFRVTESTKEKQLRDLIIQSADHCQMIVDEFQWMKRKLKDFTEKQGD